jgi:hypothetical protein
MSKTTAVIRNIARSSRCFSSAAAKPQVVVVALTGGPCGGKTSALSALSAKLPQISEFRVVQVPELATLFHNAGVHYPMTGTGTEQLVSTRFSFSLGCCFHCTSFVSPFSIYFMFSFIVRIGIMKN